MKLLRRNLTEFAYMAYKGKEEILDYGKHTGRYEVRYGDPEIRRGMIDTPSGYAQSQFFGINPDYTHVLILDDPNADIKEAGRVVCKGVTYEIRAVRPSLNFLSVALKKLTEAEAGDLP